MALTSAYQNVNTAYKNFFEKKTKYPKFKSKKKSKDSYTTYNQKGSIKLIDNKYIKLPKFKEPIKIKLSRKLPENSSINSVTVSKTKSGKYYVSILCEYETPQVMPTIPTEKNTLGLDYASDGLYVDSNNTSADYPKFYRKAQKKLARAQRQLSRKQPNSKNREKARLRVANEHIANQRLDFLHKLSTNIANNYNYVCVEDINLQNLSRCLKLGKSTMDNGFGIFRVLLSYKLADRGGALVKVDKYYPSSKTCHECGHINKNLTLKDREWVCPNCGKTIDRDYNAALNIRDEGSNILLS